MTAPVTAGQVKAALDQLREEAHLSGRRPSVLALAHLLGLPNTTLRRRFPDICADIATRRQPAGTDEETNAAAGFHDTLLQETSRLRRDNRELTEHLELAIANIQRLTLDNHRLRAELEVARLVSPIRRS